MLEFFKAQPGLGACLRKGKWRRKGNREGNRLWPIVFNIFNALIECGPFRDDADLAIGGMVLARDAASIAVQFFGWRPRGEAEDFWLIFTLIGLR
jgi:hypothetical protein